MAYNTRKAEYFLRLTYPIACIVRQQKIVSILRVDKRIVWNVSIESQALELLKDSEMNGYLA